MKPAELVAQCENSIKTTKIGEPMIVLRVRAGKSPQRKLRYLAGPGSPRGRIVAWGNDFDTCFFKAQEVLDFVQKIPCSND